jgi:hypothetical protein
MGEHFEIQKVEAEMCGTLIQVDFKGDTTQGRMFIPTRDIFKALNNYMQYDFEARMKEMGMEKINPKAPPEGLID